MGLDMYLTKELYLGEYPKDKNGLSPRDKLNISHPDYTFPQGEVKKVVMDVMYWRKANAIHAWFVENVQDGKDECKSHYVSIDHLKELLRVVREALKAKDPSEYLPSKSGFFFGHTEYDEWYYEDLKSTEKGLVEIFENLEEGWDYYYRSSW